MKSQHKGPEGLAKGFALLMVLWLIAALSIISSALAKSIRNEAEVITRVRDVAVGNSVADAAIRLTLQKLINEKKLSTHLIQQSEVSILGSQALLEIIPMNGYINLNEAPEGLLADAFEFGAGLSKDQAQKLAASAISYRERRDDAGMAIKFHSVEELLRLPGSSYSLYAKLRGCVSTEFVGSGRVNAYAATRQTLVILSGGNDAVAGQLMESRRHQPEMVDLTRLQGNYIEQSPTSFLKIRARVKFASAGEVVRTWIVDIATKSHGLPWRTIRIIKGDSDAPLQS